MSERPLPVIAEPDSSAFWAATASHELTYQRCSECERVVFYPRRHCPYCASLQLSVHKSTGMGKIYTFTIVRRSDHPFFGQRVPFVIAWIELDEGFRMLSNVIDTGLDQLTIGLPVQVQWEDYDDLSIPVFKKADSA
jgi:uncharacterized protein